MIESDGSGQGDAGEIKPKPANDTSKGHLRDWQRIEHGDSDAVKSCGRKVTSELRLFGLAKSDGAGR